MTMSELETAVRERARVVAIVFDNQRYGTIRAHQERRGKGTAATDLGPIDFAAAAIASGRGVPGRFGRRIRAVPARGARPRRPDRAAPKLDRRWLSIDTVSED